MSKHEAYSKVDSRTGYSNLNQTKKAIGFLETEEMSFISTYILNSLMHRGEKSESWLSQANFAFTKSQLKRKGDLYLVKKSLTCYSVTAGVLMLAFKTENLIVICACFNDDGLLSHGHWKFSTSAEFNTLPFLLGPCCKKAVFYSKWRKKAKGLICKMHKFARYTNTTSLNVTALGLS